MIPPEALRIGGRFLPVLALVLSAVGCRRPIAVGELYGIWMDSVSNRYSLTLLAGGKAEVRTYDHAGLELTRKGAAWRLDEGTVKVEVGAERHILSFDGRLLSDGTWALVRI